MKALVLVAVLVGTAGCSADMEKLREEQDARLNSEGTAVVVAEFKEKHEANPKDAKIAYLYGRLTKGADLRRIAEQLVKDEPDFAWGHYLLRSSLMERGLYEEALEEVRTAVRLAPNSKVLKKTLAEESSLAVLSATSADEVASRMIKAEQERKDDPTPTELWLGKRVLELTGNDMDAIKPWFSAAPASVGEADILVKSNKGQRGAEDLSLTVYVRNKGSSSFEIHGDDVRKDWVGACFTTDGARVGPTPDVFTANDRTQCRTCWAVDIAIPPGSMGRPNVYFRGSPEKFDRCVLFNIPRRGSTLLVKL